VCAPGGRAATQTATTLGETGSSGAGDPSVEAEIDRLAEQFGGRAGLIEHIIGAAEDDDEHDESCATRQKGNILALRLNRDELRRLDEQSMAMDMPRKRWVQALIRSKLYHTPQFSRADRVNLSGIVRELRKLECHLGRTVRALGDRSAPARELIARFDELDRFRARVVQLAQAIDAAFKGNDSYWRAPIADAETENDEAHGAVGRSDAQDPGQSLAGEPPVAQIRRTSLRH
jgi:hypothetical protein